MGREPGPAALCVPSTVREAVNTGHLQEEARRQLVEGARARVAAQRGRKSRRTDPFFAEVEDVLHAAGLVETKAGCAAPSVAAVRPAGVLHVSLLRGLHFVGWKPIPGSAVPGHPLSEARQREVLEQAEKILSAAGYRVGLNWNAQPPRLLVTTIPVQQMLF